MKCHARYWHHAESGYFTVIIVTGANGFIGSAMVWQLNQMGQTNIIATDTVDLTKRNLLHKRQFTEFFQANELWSFLATPEAQKKSDLDYSHGCLFFNDRKRLGISLRK